MSPSDAGSKSERTGKRPLTPVAPAVPRGSPARRAPAALRAARHAPWPRSGPTAKAGCVPRLAKSGAAVLTASLASSPCWRTARTIPRPACLFRSYSRKNPERCDLFHISLAGPGLDRRHEKTDPNLIRRAGRSPHRLRSDRHRRRSGPGCAALSPAGLKASRKLPACVICVPLDTSAHQSIRFTASGVFRGAVAAASMPHHVSRKIRQARRVLQRPIIHHFNDRLIAASFCFRFGLRRRFIPAPHPPQKIANARPWP